MRIFPALLLFLSIGLSAQKPLEIKIDTISWDDSENENRKFTVRYELKNLTDKSLQFFFNPNGLTPSTAGSMTNMAYYKVYENDSFIEIGNAFRTTQADFETEQIGQHLPTQEERDAALKKYFLDTYGIDLDAEKAEMQKEGFSTDVYLSKISSKKLLHDIFKLKPYESRWIEQVFYWNKDRYYRNHDIEYYLDENHQYDFEITMVLLKEAFRERLEPEDYHQMMEDEHFIQGVFISDKKKIHFGN